PYASGRSFHSKDPTTDPLSPLSLHDALPISQQALADSLKLTRGRYAKYEDGANEPPIEVLVGMSKYFKISLDLLLTVDLAKYPIDRILTLADNRIILPITVDAKGENKIEIKIGRASCRERV